MAALNLYQDILGDDSEDKPTKTRFKLISTDNVGFDYQVLKDGTFITEDNTSFAEGMGLIEILERDIPANRNMFNGSPEPIISDGLKFVQPTVGIRNLEGEDLEMRPFGEWKCMRCQHITIIPVTNGIIKEPFECENNSCGRKGAFKPLFPKELIKPVWKLPIQPMPASDAEIYQEIYEFSKKYLILKEEEYHILTLWVMASWLVEDFSTCPYLCMIAPKSSGKTQVLNVLGELAYRAVTAISVTAPSLFRSIEMWHITLLIDEAEYQVRQETESGQALYGCLNGGYKRNSYAIRTEGENRVPAAYEVFGFKAIASTRLFHPTLESRSIIINMTQGIPEKILIDTHEAEILRSKLLFWRFARLTKLPLVFPESKSGRLIEMFIPLFTVAQVLKNKNGIKMPISYEDLIKLLNNKISQMESQRKEEEKESADAQIIQAIIQLENMPINESIGSRESIKVKEIAELLNWDDAKSSAVIGRKLKVMGIKTKHTMHGNIIEHLDPEVQKRLEELEKRFIKG